MLTDEERKYQREWYKNNVEKRRATARENMKRWRANNPEKSKEIQRRFRKKFPERHKRYFLKKSYGMTLEQREAMLAAQGGKCAICTSPEPNGRYWHIDHCHSSMKVRGLLCNNCNLMLGHSKDNVETLAAAIRYLSAG
jgi:hypothetical protein